MSSRSAGVTLAPERPRLDITDPVAPIPKAAWDPRTVGALATTLVLWASAFVGIRAGLAGYTPGQVALLRYLVASAVLAAYCRFRRMRLPEPRDWPLIALAGAVGFTVYNLALNAAELRVTAAAASFAGNTAPVFSALMAAVLLGERLALAGWIGISLSLAGVGLIAAGEGTGFRFEPAVLLLLVAPVAQSAYFVLQKPLLGRYGPLAFTAPALWAGTVFLLPFLPGLAAHLLQVPAAPTLAVVYLGVFPAAIGYVTWAYVLARLPVTRTASFLYVIPALTTLIGWVWLGELPSLLSVAGGVLAVLGVVVVNARGRAAR